MDNKTFRKEQLLAAGWNPKTPRSGYWHRKGVSTYSVGVNDAYESELLFPEKVRQAFLKVNPEIEFADRELNLDTTNARIAERLRKNFTENVKKGMEMGGLGGSMGSQPLSIPPFRTTAPPPEVKKPRYKIATIVNGYSLVDCTSGKSIEFFIHTVTGLTAYERATAACARLNRIQNATDEATRMITSFPNEWQNTLTNLDAEIEFLTRVRLAVATKNVYQLKSLLPMTSDRARSALYRFFTIALLRMLGINEDTLKP